MEKLEMGGWDLSVVDIFDEESWGFAEVLVGKKDFATEAPSVPMLVQSVFLLLAIVPELEGDAPI